MKLEAADFRISARSVPESSDVYSAIPVIDAVDDPVRSNNYLTKERIAELRQDPPHLRVISKKFGAADEELTEGHCARW